MSLSGFPRFITHLPGYFARPIFWFQLSWQPRIWEVLTVLVLQKWISTAFLVLFSIFDLQAIFRLGSLRFWPCLRLCIMQNFSYGMPKVLYCFCNKNMPKRWKDCIQRLANCRRNAEVIFLYSFCIRINYDLYFCLFPLICRTDVSNRDEFDMHRSWRR